MEIDRFYFLPDIVANSMYDSEAVLKNYGDNTQENLRAQRGSYKLMRVMTYQDQESYLEVIYQ